MQSEMSTYWHTDETALNQGNILISIIIPVYNVAPYISRCLDSILMQKYEQCEILCIDDCSMDSSRYILAEYQKSGVKVICNEQNLGAGASRNKGLDIAEGEYIWFVDPDDWVQNDSLDQLSQYLIHFEPDVICFGMIHRYQSKMVAGKRHYNRVRKLKTGIMTGAEYFCDAFEKNDYSSSPCDKLFRKDYLIDNGFRFEEGILEEDELFSLKTVLGAKRIISIVEQYYNYFHRDGSAMLASNFYSMARLKSRLYNQKKLWGIVAQEERIEVKEMLCRLLCGWERNTLECFRKIEIIDSRSLIDDESLLPILHMVSASFYEGYFPYKIPPKYLCRIHESKELYIYGNGKVAHGFVDLLREKKIEVTSIIVTDTGEYAPYFGIPVVGISSLVKDDLEHALIFVMNRDYHDQNDMAEKALMCGFAKENTILYDSFLRVNEDTGLSV